MQYKTTEELFDIGGFYWPAGLRFTTDGRHIILADCRNHRVCKIDAEKGGAVVSSLPLHATQSPCDVHVHEDGSIVVAVREGVATLSADGVTMAVKDVGFRPFSLTYSPVLNGMVVMEKHGGRVALLPEEWGSSLRCAWVSACVRSTT
jgi:DNA-binding beta-propeller fold protein YncE